MWTNKLAYLADVQHKIKKSLKLKNLLLYSDCIKKLKSISIKISSSVNNSMENENKI